MKRSTATIFFVLATLAASSSVFMSGGAASCDNVPTTTWSDACLNIGSTPAMYNLCQETLQHAPDSAAATAYAIEAAKVAWQSYEATETEAEQQVLYGSLPGDERAAFERCLMMYATARGRMAAVMEEMSNCEFKKTVQEYADAVDYMESCANELSGFQSSSLVAMNAADRDLTTVAVDLGGLVVGNGKQQDMP